MNAPTADVPIAKVRDKLEEQREALWDAQASIEIVAEALLVRFSRDWPAEVPDYRRALERASQIIGEVANDLEPDVLLDEVENGEQPS